MAISSRISIALRIAVAWLLLCGQVLAAGIIPPPVTANTPALAPYTHAANPTIWLYGDSRSSIASFCAPTATPALYSKLPTSTLAWAQRFSGTKLVWNLTSGYCGSSQTVFKMNIVPNNQTLGVTANSALLTAGNGSGSGYTSASTCSSAQGGTYGSPTVDGNGSVLSIPILTAATGQTAAPIVTCTGGTGLNAVAVVGGSGTFGDVGETSCQIYNRIADLEAVAVAGDQVVVSSGDNDEINGLSLAASEACVKITLDRLLSDGYYVIFDLDGPRLTWGANQDGAALAVQYRKQLFARRKWITRYVQQDATKNNYLYPHIVLLDTFPEVADNTSAYSDPRSGYTADGLHRSQRSAYIGGYKISQIENGWLPSPAGLLANTSQADGFDGTYNPAGPINPNPMLTGTVAVTTSNAPVAAGGTTGGLTIAAGSTLPTSYTFSAGGTTGTQTVTAGVETTRTDNLNGSRPSIAVSCGGGSATQTYTLAMSGYTQLTSTGITTGTKLALDIDVEVSGQMLMVLAPSATLIVNDTSTTLLSAGDGATSASGQFALADNYVYDGFVPPLGAGIPIHLSSPTITLNNVGTTAGTDVSVKGSLTWGFNCSGGAGSGGGTVKVTRFAVHPVA